MEEKQGGEKTNCLLTLSSRASFALTAIGFLHEHESIIENPPFETA